MAVACQLHNQNVRDATISLSEHQMSDDHPTFKCLKALDVFEKDGPFTVEAFLEIAYQVQATVKCTPEVRENFKASFARCCHSFPLDELEKIYTLALKNLTVIDAFGLVRMADLTIPLETLDQLQCDFIGSMMSRYILKQMIRGDDMLQTASQRARLARCIRLNLLESRKKPKD
jgi:hypothetical protein